MQRLGPPWKPDKLLRFHASLKQNVPQARITDIIIRHIDHIRDKMFFLDKKRRMRRADDAVAMTRGAVRRGLPGGKREGSIRRNTPMDFILQAKHL